MAVKRGRKQARRSGESSIPGYMWLLAGLLIGGAIVVTAYVKMPHAIDGVLPRPNPAAHPATASDGGVAPEGNIASTTKPAEPKKPQYDFYTLLPEKEVVIPDEELSAQVKAEAAAKLASQQQAVAPVAPGSSTSTPAGTTAPVTAGITTANQNATASTTTNLPASASDATKPASPATPEQAGQYLLQAGAFRNSAQADDLKARIALLGLVGHVEVVQTPSGAMHRVRLGPYATASELEAAKQKLGSGGLPAVAIRVK